MKTRNKALLVLLALVLVTGLGAKMYSNVTMGDDEWIGLGASAGRIVFDNQTPDEVSVMDAQFGVGILDPHAPLEVDNTTVFTTATYVSGQHNVFLVNDTPTAGNGVVGSSLAFGGPGRSDRGQAAIAAVQTTSDVDQVGLSFYTHPSTSYSALAVETMLLDHDGNLAVDGTVFIGVPEHENEDGDHMLTRADETVGYGDGGYAFYARKDIWSVSDHHNIFIFFECPFEDDPGPSTTLWVQWLVKDNTTGTVTEGDTLLEASSGFGEDVVIAGSGDNTLTLYLGRFIPGPPTKRGSTYLREAGSHTYDAALLMMWVHASE